MEDRCYSCVISKSPTRYGISHANDMENIGTAPFINLPRVTSQRKLNGTLNF
jgi:hypothetical protein